MILICYRLKHIQFPLIHMDFDETKQALMEQKVH
jgi:hypothetical protein